MRLSDLASAALKSATARLRQGAIAYGVCAICSIAAAVMATSASVIALEPHVGAVYARLIVAAAFALLGAAAIASLRVRRRRAAPPPAAEQPKEDARFAQVAMIVEAVMLGYTLSSRRADRP